MKERVRDEIRAELIFVGDGVDPDKITSVTGVEPSQAYRKGDVIEKQPEQVRHKGLWRLRSGVAPDRPLDEHIHGLLDRLESGVAAISELARGGQHAKLYCGLFTEGAPVGTGVEVRLESDTLRRMADTGAPFELRVYCEGKGDGAVASDHEVEEMSA